jgi:protein CLEC16A
MSFWSRGKKKRFSLERLKELLANLQKNPIVTDRNKGVLVETLRELAELLVWGDQNDERLFDFFLEKNVFAVLLRVMEQKDTQVHVQLLQSLSILLENIAAPSALYYLLSCDRVNAVITHHFDFSDEELMAYYVSFLKTLSLKLDASTVQFYFNDETQEFPLYTEAVKFFNHGEGMVRVAVRTITLAVFKVSSLFSLSSLPTLLSRWRSLECGRL